MMSYEDGSFSIVNVRVCNRIGGERSILVCERCYNEVEGDVTEFFTCDGASGSGIPSSVIPRYSFCPWCSAPLREE